MALHYILDGYNIVKQVPSLALKNLRGSREKLVKLIEINKPQGSVRNKVTIVFDGKAGVAHQQQASVAKVTYSQHESADEMMRRMVASSPRKKEMIVVTDDKELKFSIRALGARVCSVRDFLLKAGIEPSTGKRARDKKSRQQDEKTISKSLEYKITDELKKIWLK